MGRGQLRGSRIFPGGYGSPAGGAEVHPTYDIFKELASSLWSGLRKSMKHHRSEWVHKYEALDPQNRAPRFETQGFLNAPSWCWTEVPVSILGERP